MQSLGPPRYRQALFASAPLERRLAQTLGGLSEEALTFEPPANPAEAAEFVRTNELAWRRLEGPVPDELVLRAERLWLLVLRTRLESRLMNGA